MIRATDEANIFTINQNNLSLEVRGLHHINVANLFISQNSLRSVHA